MRGMSGSQTSRYRALELLDPDTDVDKKLIQWTKNPVLDKNNSLIYVGGLPLETNVEGDIQLIFDDVPIVKVLKIWKMDVFLVATLFLVHESHVPLICAYDKKQLFRNIPPIIVLPVDVFKKEMQKQHRNVTHGAFTSKPFHFRK